MTKKLRVSMQGVLDAMGSFPPELTAYLHTQTGELYSHSADLGWSGPDLEDDADELPERLEDALVQLPRIEGRDEFRWMEEFARSCEDEEDRDELLVALDGRGAFARFRAAVARLPGMGRRWNAFHEQKLVEEALAFFARHGLEPQYELARRPEPEPAPAPKPNGPPIELLDLLLLGAPEGKTELVEGRVRRQIRVKGPGDARKLFARLAREVSESNGIPWRKRFIEGGRTTFDAGRMHLSVEGDVVALEVDATIEAWRAFAE